MRSGRANGLRLEPLLAEFIDYLVRVFSFAQTAVVATERAPQVAVFLVVIEAQDRAAVAQVGVGVEEVVVGPTDLLDPEWHDLHEPERASDRYRVPIKITFDLDDRENQFGRQIDAFGFHMHRREHLDAFVRVPYLPFETSG